MLSSSTQRSNKYKIAIKLKPQQHPLAPNTPTFNIFSEPHHHHQSQQLSTLKPYQIVGFPIISQTSMDNHRPLKKHSSRSASRYKLSSLCLPQNCIAKQSILSALPKKHLKTLGSELDRPPRVSKSKSKSKSPSPLFEQFGRKWLKQIGEYSRRLKRKPEESLISVSGRWREKVQKSSRRRQEGRRDEGRVLREWQQVLRGGGMSRQREWTEVGIEVKGNSKMNQEVEWLRKSPYKFFIRE